MISLFPFQVLYFVSSELLKCWLLKLIAHPMTISSERQIGETDLLRAPGTTGSPKVVFKELLPIRGLHTVVLPPGSVSERTAT